MLHYIFLLFSIIFLNSTFLAFDSDKNNKSDSVRKEKQVGSDLQSSIFQAPQDKKIVFALHIKKRTKQDLVEEDTVSFEEIDSCNKNQSENFQESLQAKLKKKLQKLREKLQPRQHAIVAEGIALGVATSGAGATVAGFGAGCGAAGTAATAAGTATVTTAAGIGFWGFLGGILTGPFIPIVTALSISSVADEVAKKNKLDEEAIKRREQEKIELEKQRELEEQRIKLEREKEEEHLRLKLKTICLELTKAIDIRNPGPCINIPEDIIGKLGPCIYVPIEQGPQVCIYVPAQNDYPPMIYVPAEDDNPPCIYVPTKEEDKNFILQFAGPAILIPGAIGSGGTIPIIIGIGAGIGWIIKEGVPLLKGIKDKIKKAQKEKEKGGGGGGGPNNNNDDDDKDKKYPHGKYENNKKHHKNSPKNIGKPPKDGQKALDKSIKVPGKDYRLGIENGQLVKFQEHSPGKYHGYIVDSSEKIIQLDKNILQESGLAKQLDKGNPYR